MCAYRRDPDKFTVTAGRDGSRSFGDHDDRWSGPRYGGGNKYKNKKYGKGRGYGGYSRGRGTTGGRPNPRSRFEDDDGDINMDSGGSKPRFTPYSRGGRGSSSRGRYSRTRDRDNNTLQRLGLPLSDEARWTKVTVPHGKKCEKDFLLKTINGQLTAPFEPVYFHHEGKNAVFYVKDPDVGSAIKRLSNRMTMPNGYKMVLHVMYSKPPIIPMDESAIKKLQERMSDRYDPTTRSLNLSSMFSDEVLRAAGMFLALNRSNVMSNVIKVIKENIPELTSLNLSNNRLLSLTHMSDMVSAASGITSLDLGKNQLRSIEELDKISGWKLDHIQLDGNDLCDRFKDRNQYISAVRKRFPKVINLDGHVLPPPITFELETSTVLPRTKESYFLNEDIQNIVVKFLREYYSLYDADNRQPLLDAYHEQALFSVTASYNPANDYKQASLNDYISESRNLLKCKDPARREKLLRQGKLPVVSQLCLLPKTTHDPNSFIVDISHASNTHLIFALSGVFKESESKSDKPPIRAFNRVFYTVPAGSGMVITNDMLTVSNATTEQIQNAFKSAGPTPSSSPVTGVPPDLPSTSLGGSDHQTMIQKFSLQSGMNLDWSGKCLEENGWDYDKSAAVFTQLNSEGRIPAQAFVK
ncbi:nuclear RNA export factor 1-like [Haliotis rufescens]|uniref:nuclear RNA export factor 1-like n=1 Tax=Haliotis rufescens TaxID=6454 RepID=UPI001EAF9466|nr:nuclear RNA export factor 1-like [Haliotis rufescens]